jgi:hypothetical protein
MVTQFRHSPFDVIVSVFQASSIIYLEWYTHRAGEVIEYLDTF